MDAPHAIAFALALATLKIALVVALGLVVLVHPALMPLAAAVGLGYAIFDGCRALVARHPAPRPTFGPVPAGRTIVLVFDDLHLGASRLAAAKREATHFVREQVGPRDQVALVTTSGVRGVFQSLTRDREALARAVDRVSLQDRSARFRYGPPYISEHQAEQIDRFGELASAGNEALELAVTQFMAEFFVDRTAALAMGVMTVRKARAQGVGGEVLCIVA